MQYKRLCLTCYNIEALLSLDEGDIVGYEGGVCVCLHAGMPGLLQLHTPAAIVQQTRPNVGHGSGDGRHSEAHHSVQLRYDITQRLEWVHIAWWFEEFKNLK